MAATLDLTLEQFATLLQGRGRLLGLDLGSRTIGLAISDSDWSVASPVSTIRRRKFSQDVAQLLDYARREQVEGLVLGLPLNMDGSEGRRVQSTRTFARNLSNLTDMPLLFWDERLSTFAAEQAMLEADMSRARRSKVVDQVAATIILQGCLERLSNHRQKMPTLPDR